VLAGARPGTAVGSDIVAAAGIAVEPVAAAGIAVESDVGRFAEQVGTGVGQVEPAVAVLDIAAEPVAVAPETVAGLAVAGVGIAVEHVAVPLGVG